jgi:cellulose synthase/poly-beta-1,6-N-acetylglucosamine synthase-like glycosyltransferase
MVAYFIFWISFLMMLYTYAIYPLLLKLLSLFKKSAEICFKADDMLPSVSVLIAAYNEEVLIEQKINSVLKSIYPAEKIEILIGSDASTDRTDDILKRLSVNPRITVRFFKQRSGKIAIINQLVTEAVAEILIMTDANVMFDSQTVFELVKHFKNEKIALVDSRMVNTGISKDGISLQEKTYIQAEAYIKHFEGLLWGTMMGPFGGCYAIRKSFYHPVPEGFLVDDFYINMKVLLQGGKCINELRAVAYEDVSNIVSIEYSRKSRIAAGSFQNLFHFIKALLRFDAISFCFFSHKVIRWFGPLFIFLLLISASILPGVLYALFAELTVLCMMSPLLDFLSARMLKFHITPLRFVAHFATSNAAQLSGFIKFLNGINSGIWQPTVRNQSGK